MDKKEKTPKAKMTVVKDEVKEPQGEPQGEQEANTSMSEDPIEVIQLDEAPKGVKAVDINPSEYSYRDGVKLSILSDDFAKIAQIIDMALKEHTHETYKELYNYVDNDGKKIKVVTDEMRATGQVRKIADVGRTLSNNPEISRDYTGQLLLFVKTIIDKTHFENVIAGVATPLAELRAEATVQSDMKAV